MSNIFKYLLLSLLRVLNPDVVSCDNFHSHHKNNDSKPYSDGTIWSILYFLVSLKRAKKYSTETFLKVQICSSIFISIKKRISLSNDANKYSFDQIELPEIGFAFNTVLIMGIENPHFR